MTPINTNRWTVYMTPEQKEQAKHLLVLLQSQGSKLKSVSEMLNYLVDEALTRQQAAERRREGE